MNPIIMAIIVVTIIGLIGAVILVAASIFMFVHQHILRCCRRT